MNITQANQISIVRILDTLGHQPKRKVSKYYTYLSPFRVEKTASFTVYLEKNYWHDYGTGEGGDTVAFAVKHLKEQNEPHTVSDALRWIGNMYGQKPSIRSIPVESHPPTKHKLVLKAAYKIEHPALIQYGELRGIPENLAASYLKELRIYNKESKKRFFALGFKNEENGYEFRNNFLKGCIGPKNISFIRGTKEQQNKIHVFEGVFDFLSVLKLIEVKRLADDAIVLNSLSMLKEATPYIQNYSYKTIYTWLDNDKSGERATRNISDFCKAEPGLQHRPMNYQYKDHKDVNEFLVHKLALTK